MYSNANIVTSVWFKPVIKMLRLLEFSQVAGAFGLAKTLVSFATVIGAAQLF